MRPRFLNFAAVISAIVITMANAADPPPKPFTLFLAGDSTMASQALVPATSGRGWGQMLQPYFQDHVRVENHAASGNSSKSFRDNGRWKILLDRVQPGDFVLIQFGHNDSKPDEARHTEPFGTFQENLTRFVTEVREREGIPLLATSVVRNIFNPDGTFRDSHGDYLIATRKVAEQQKVPLLELNQKTADVVINLGPERSKKLFNNLEPGEFPQHPDGVKDGSHFNATGAARVCDLAIEEIQAKIPELAKGIRLGRQVFGELPKKAQPR